jgi:hypothetical protein
MTSKRVLMVEGPDDVHVVKHICGQRQLGNIEKIRPYGGKDSLIDGIIVCLKESDISVLGIILDADTDIQARWQAVTDRLITAGYCDVPEVPATEGTVIEPPTNSLLPRVGIWLMPNNQLPGILEDFLCFLVPDEDPLLAYVDQTIANIPVEQRRFSDLKEAKVKIHTWLAWQKEPGKPFGQAISAHYLDPCLPMVDIFAAWLKKTFFRDPL